MMWPYFVAALALAQQSPLTEQPLLAADSGIDPTLFVGPPLEVDLAPPAPAPADPPELVVAECVSSSPEPDADADAFAAAGVRDLLAALHERLPAETAKAQQLLRAENDEIISAAAAHAP